MLLATRCPHCATAFRIAPEQLKLRGGRVRCGVCNEVFDAARHLIDADGNPRPEIAAPAPEPELPSPAPAEPEPPQAELPEALLAEPAGSVEPPAAPAEAPVLSEPVVLRRRGAAPEGEGKDIDALLDALGAFSAAAQASDPVRPDPAPEPEPQPELRPQPSFSAIGDGTSDARVFAGDDEQEAGRARPWWTAAALILALLLIAQALWTFRVGIATRLPFTRPLFEAVCAPLGCTVGYPRAKDRLTIESSSLEPWDAAQAQAEPPAGQPDQAEPLPARRLALTVVLRNRADFPQDWPAIELSLTDLSDAATARRVLLPAAYLPARQRARPIGAGQEQTLRIPIETVAAPAAGYRVSIFYP